MVHNADDFLDTSTSSEATLQKSIKESENKNWWNRSWSSIDVKKQQLQRRRHFDYSCPHEGVETMRNLVEHAAICSSAPDRIHKRMEENFRAFAARSAELPPSNKLEHLRIREGARIANHMLEDKCRIMDVDAPVLQGVWTSDWTDPAKLRAMNKLRDRVQTHADRRNNNFMLRERNHVEQLQRHKMSEDNIVSRLETEAGLAPLLTIPRNEVYQSMSRIKGEPGLARHGVSPETGYKVMNMAKMGYAAHKAAYDGAQSRVRTRRF